MPTASKKQKTLVGSVPSSPSATDETPQRRKKQPLRINWPYTICRYAGRLLNTQELTAERWSELRGVWLEVPGLHLLKPTDLHYAYTLQTLARWSGNPIAGMVTTSKNKSKQYIHPLPPNVDRFNPKQTVYIGMTMHQPRDDVRPAGEEPMSREATVWSIRRTDFVYMESDENECDKGVSEEYQRFFKEGEARALVIDKSGGTKAQKKVKDTNMNDNPDGISVSPPSVAATHKQQSTKSSEAKPAAPAESTSLEATPTQSKPARNAKPKPAKSSESKPAQSPKPKPAKSFASKPAKTPKPKPAKSSEAKAANTSDERLVESDEPKLADTSEPAKFSKTKPTKPRAPKKTESLAVDGDCEQPKKAEIKPKKNNSKAKCKASQK